MTKLKINDSFYIPQRIQVTGQIATPKTEDRGVYRESQFISGASNWKKHVEGH